MNTAASHSGDEQKRLLARTCAADARAVNRHPLQQGIPALLGGTLEYALSMRLVGAVAVPEREVATP
ncbi:MAG: hypothetical protein M3460_15875 [Actinomycetota bacterium]|nr:hypothetical protein [Actinomycetota bacterium]